VGEVARGEASFAELCRRYGISRKTGYVWWERFATEGVRGLEDRSRRPRQSPRATPWNVVQVLKAFRRRHPNWGPKKLLSELRELHPDLRLPALSTAARILKRQGLIKKRRRGGRPTRILPRGGWGSTPNDLWTADHKGRFRLGDGTLCYPLTVADSYSRYLLRVQACSSTCHEQARPVFESAFREYGLPMRILTDNGPPFGSQGIVGLSQLSIWWLKLGIQVERIEPGRPEQNGQHERMHRTLKQEAVKPASASAAAQQRRFNRFRRAFNEERPHEALALQKPADHYRPSPRLYGRETPGLDYPRDYERRQVRGRGQIKWRGELVYVAQLLEGEPIALKEEDERRWAVYFGPLMIGWLHAGEHHLRRPNPRPPNEKEVLPMS
jgi:transposase InsO family protein